MVNTLVLSTGCLHVPQGAGRSEGLVHNIRSAGRAGGSATGLIPGLGSIGFLRRQTQALDAGVRFGRRQATERGVRAFFVAIPHPGAGPVAGPAATGKCLRAYALVLQRAP